MAALKAALAKFRSQAVANSQVLEQGRKEREEKLGKKTGAGGEGKAAAARKPAAKRPRAKAPAASAASDGAPSASGATADWKSLPPPASLEPLGWRQMQVIEFLRKADAPQSVADIRRGINRDLDAEEDLRASLATQPRVSVSQDGAMYTYQAAIQVKDRAALLNYIRTAPQPVALGEISDAYGAVVADVEVLKREGQVWALHSYDLQDDVLFPVDPRLAGLAPVEAEIAELWQQQELPEDDEDMAAELRKIGLKPAPRKAPRKRAPSERKKKARKAAKLRNVTNVHLMELFEGDAPVQID